MAKKKTFESHGIVVEYNDMGDEILEALYNAVDRGLRAIGEKAVEYAQEKVPKDTGRLHDAIMYEVDGDDVYIGVEHMEPEPYGIYVEFGTGIYAENGGRQTPWTYQDEKGNWHYTHGQKPQPFLRPAATEHADEYRAILTESLQNA